MSHTLQSSTNAGALKRRRVQKSRPKSSAKNYATHANQFRFGGATKASSGDTTRQTTKNGKKGKTMHLAQSDRRIL